MHKIVDEVTDVLMRVSVAYRDAGHAAPYDQLAADDVVGALLSVATNMILTLSEGDPALAAVRLVGAQKFFAARLAEVSGKEGARVH